MADNPTIHFYDITAESYFHEWKANDVLKPLLRVLVDLLPKSSRILDLGCGRGVESKRLVELGTQVVGVDLSEKGLQIAKK